MTRLIDGPAAGVTLFLRCAPHFLRVVREGEGAWDALDQLEDRPKSTESIVVYEMQGEPTWIHVCRRPTGGDIYRGGAYTVVADQPSDAVLRDQAAWEAWAREAFTARAPARVG